MNGLDSVLKGQIRLLEKLESEAIPDTQGKKLFLSESAITKEGLSMRPCEGEQGQTQLQDGWAGQWGWARPGHQPAGLQCS